MDDGSTSLARKSSVTAMYTDSFEISVFVMYAMLWT